ncbi:hypothetical protein BDF19DRAFT_422275 [Syncephalis fuscata]|nr:hypothetical protein BDF19DRAFT_422275 [Syncephalis fuscata]
MPTNKLVEALRNTIDQYLIIAGRLVAVKNEKYKAHPSDKGLRYRESQSANDISTFNSNWPQNDIPLAWQAVSWDEGTDVPLAIHVTRFANNSGLVICSSGHH